MKDNRSYGNSPPKNFPKVELSLRELYLRQRGKCFYCLQPMNPRVSKHHYHSGWTRDHLFAKCHGNEELSGNAKVNRIAEETMERDLRAEGWGPEDCYPETAEGSKSELNDLLAAYRQLSADMAVLFARKKIHDARVGGQAVGMETYRLIFTGSELGNIWRQMAEIEKLIKQTWYP